ncbi:hypothetical protein BCV70DRAFT_7107 [Testicularia cyperi]|uniref:Uncharacterized protein n=1 Tax=Testicularia cyperi TaxID=1882483 RepID=A0A317XZY4_9BASI|nr:hypothetical protein BCV70DRAFT_7107 [Testicularia cyperi]
MGESPGSVLHCRIIAAVFLFGGFWTRANRSSMDYNTEVQYKRSAARMRDVDRPRGGLAYGRRAGRLSPRARFGHPPGFLPPNLPHLWFCRLVFWTRLNPFAHRAIVIARRQRSFHGSLPLFLFFSLSLSLSLFLSLSLSFSLVLHLSPLPEIGLITVRDVINSICYCIRRRRCPFAS